MPLADWSPPLSHNRESCQGSQCFSVPHGGVPRFAAGTYRPLLFILLSYVGAVGWGRGVRPEPVEHIHYTQWWGWQVKSCVDCSGLDTDFAHVVRSSPSTQKQNAPHQFS